MSDYVIKKKQSTKTKKKKKKEVEEEIPDTESSDEELDLTKECHPIAHYVNDRAEMISQMFSVIKGNKLKAMLPPILKDYDVEKLKLKCLDHLLGMSEKRIICILEGEILESSSESEVASDVESEDSESDASSEQSEKVITQKSSTRIRNKRKSDTESIGKASKISKVEEPSAPEQGKTLLEILELEMRARAIRALLKQSSEPPVVQDPPNNSGCVVDLTTDDEDFPTVVKIEPQSTEQEQNFENKVVQSKGVEKQQEVEVTARKLKMMVELELRNKLIKKKTYRTRQQRIENLEEEVNNSQEPSQSLQAKKQEEVVSEIRVKEEPTEIVIEDPEEGEVSSDEDDIPVVVKVEKPSSPQPEENSEKKVDGERITAIDDGEFVANKNVEWENETLELFDKPAQSPKVIDLDDKSDGEEANKVDSDAEETTQDKIHSPEESSVNTEQVLEENEENDDSSKPGEEEEETTWRGRWLKKDEVQKVVKSSKICGLVKKRLKKKKSIVSILAEKISAPEVEKPDSNLAPPILEGSVSHYEEITGKRVVVSEVSTNSTSQSGDGDVEPNEQTRDSVASKNKNDTFSIISTVGDAEESNAKELLVQDSGGFSN